MAASSWCEVMVSPLHTILFSWNINYQSGLSSLIDYSFTLTSREGGAIEGASSKTLRYQFGDGFWNTRSVDINIGENSSTSLVSGWSTYISHDDYGYGSFTMSFEFAFDHTVNGEYIGTITDSTTFTLDRILPRTSLSVRNGTLGEAQRLTVSRYADGQYSHTITYECGEYTGAICADSEEYAYDFTPPLEWANNAPNASKVTVKYSIVTNGLTSTPLEYIVTYAVPDYVVPTCSMTISDPLGHKEIFGAYIQNQCRLTVDVTAEALYGASILTYKVTVGNTVLETNNIICRIPQQANFLSRYEWEAKPNDEKANFFTIGPTDILVKGSVEDSVDEYTAGHRSSDLLAKYKGLQGCLQVERYGDNTGPGRGLPHYHVIGV